MNGGGANWVVVKSGGGIVSVAIVTGVVTSDVVVMNTGDVLIFGDVTGSTL